MNAEEYVSKVLAMLPETLPHRAQIAAELRSHIAERLAHGHAMDDVLRQLGDPTTLATSCLSAEPLVSAPFGSRVVAKIVDAVGVLAIIGPTALIAAQLVPVEFRPVLIVLMVALGGSLLFGAYTMASEYMKGQTIGKWLQSLR